MLNRDVYIEHHNLLNSTLFVLGKLDALKLGIENKGYNINKGPQKNRGEISAISSQLNCLDTDFRKALYLHHIHHT